MNKVLRSVFAFLVIALIPVYSNAKSAICSCVNEPITTEEKARYCKAALDAMSPEETVNAKGACNAKIVRQKGLDVCTCLKTFHTDPAIIKACEEIIGKDTKPSEMAQLAEKCS